MLSLLFIWQPIILVLLDITPMMGVLDGVLMELQDCALPLLKGELGSGGERDFIVFYIFKTVDFRALLTGLSIRNYFIKSFFIFALLQLGKMYIYQEWINK